MDRAPKEHHLKTVQPWFDLLWDKDASFELLQNDRDYRPGDTLLLQHWDPESGWQERWIRARVLSVVSHAYLADLPRGGPLQPGWLALGTREIERFGHAKIPIGSLPLSHRTENALRRSRIATLEELLAWSDEDLLQIRNFGKASLHEVKSALQRRPELVEKARARTS